MKYESIKIATKPIILDCVGVGLCGSITFAFSLKIETTIIRHYFSVLPTIQSGTIIHYRYLLIEKKSAILTNSILKCIKFCINTSSINKQRVPLSFNSLKKIKRGKLVSFLLFLHHMVLEIYEQQSFLKNSVVFHTFKVPSISDQSSCNIIFWQYPFL